MVFIRAHSYSLHQALKSISVSTTVDLKSLHVTVGTKLTDAICIYTSFIPTKLARHIVSSILTENRLFHTVLHHDYQHKFGSCGTKVKQPFHKSEQILETVDMLIFILCNSKSNHFQCCFKHTGVCTYHAGFFGVHKFVISDHECCSCFLSCVSYPLPTDIYVSCPVIKH